MKDRPTAMRGTALHGQCSRVRTERLQLSLLVPLELHATRTGGVLFALIEGFLRTPGELSPIPRASLDVP